MDQISLFDLPRPGEKLATNCYFGNRTPVGELDDLSRRMVPKGAYQGWLDNRRLVLEKSDLTIQAVPSSHAFMHYIVDGIVYSAICVG